MPDTKALNIWLFVVLYYQSDTMKKPGTTRIFIFLLIFIIFFAFLFSVSSWYLNKYVRVRIEKAFSEQTSGEYKLSIGSLKLNFLRRHILFANVAVQPDKLKEGDPSYEGHARELSFDGLHVIKYLMGRGAEVNEILISEPKVTMISGEISDVQDDADSTAFSLYGVIKEFAKSIKVNRFNVENFEFSLFNKRTDSTPSLYSKRNSFLIVKLKIDQETSKLPGMFEADTISLSIFNFSYTANDSLYTYDVGTMHVNYTDSMLVFDSVKMIPNFNKRWFGNVAGKQTDRFDINVGRLIFERVDLRHFFEYHGFKSQKLSIQSLVIKAFRDKNDKREYFEPPSVQRLLKTSPIYIRIDTVKVYDSRIVLEEVAPTKSSPGSIIFDKINAEMTGLTNDSSLFTSESGISFKANSMFMGEGNLGATYFFPLSTMDMEFKCTGLLTGLPMNTLNRMLEPTVGVSIKSGYIDTLEFEFDAGENTSNGWMRFIYNDLEVELPEETGEKHDFKDKLLIFLANNVVLKKNNPTGNKPVRKVPIQYERNKQRFMFNYTWKTMYSGIKETVGIPKMN